MIIRKTPYEKLGIKPDAPTDQIKKAFRELAKEMHPDVSQSESTAEFCEMKEAYELLVSPERRAKYDATGQESERLRTQDIATSELQALFMRVIDDVDCKSIDMVKYACDVIKASKESLAKEKRSIETKRKRYADAGERLITKLEDNPIKHAFDNQVALCDKALHQAGARLALMEQMLKMMADYEWKTDKSVQRKNVFF